MSEDRYKNHEYAEAGSFIVLGLILTIVIPLWVGFSLGGFAETFVAGRPIQFGDFLLSYLIYYIFIVCALIGIPVLKLREMVLTKAGEHPANQEEPEFFNVAIIHDPVQDGALYQLSEELKFTGKKNFMYWSRNGLRLLVVSILFFGILGIFESAYSFSFVGVPQQTLQQVTKLGAVFFSIEPPSFSETMLILFVFCCLLSVVGYFSSKFKWGKAGYYFGGVLMSFAVAGIWLGYHTLVYGNSAEAQQFTFFFGLSVCLLTLLFGSIIPAYISHVMNNLFVKLSEVFSGSNEDVILIAVLILLAILILWVGIEIAVHKYKKRREAYREIVPR